MTKHMVWSLGILLCAGLSVMYTKYYVASLRQLVAEQERACTTLKNSIHLLSLEWAHLNAPERLEKLCTQFLDFTPPQNDQMKGHI
jgi:hypothetical protein